MHLQHQVKGGAFIFRGRGGATPPLDPPLRNSASKQRETQLCESESKGERETADAEKCNLFPEAFSPGGSQIHISDGRQRRPCSRGKPRASRPCSVDGTRVRTRFVPRRARRAKRTRQWQRASPFPARTALQPQSAKDLKHIPNPSPFTRAICQSAQKLHFHSHQNSLINLEM